jgi:hypothetical protein
LTEFCFIKENPLRAVFSPTESILLTLIVNVVKSKDRSEFILILKIKKGHLYHLLWLRRWFTIIMLWRNANVLLHLTLQQSPKISNFCSLLFTAAETISRGCAVIVGLICLIKIHKTCLFFGIQNINEYLSETNKKLVIVRGGKFRLLTKKNVYSNMCFSNLHI